MKRRVFYIPGFDPHPPRRYRELYRSESQKQARISGYQVEQKASALKDGYGWSVSLNDEGTRRSSEAVIEILGWSDIVKTSMSSGIVATYWSLAKTAWIYIRSGTLFDLMTLRKGPIIAALYPVGFLILQLLFALLVAYGIAQLIELALPYLMPFALLIIWPILKGFQAIDHRIFAYYLMQDYAHSAQFKGAYAQDLKERLHEFSQKIAQACTEDWDEVLVIGHSSGAHLGVSVLAELERQHKGPRRGTLSFLSLG